MAEFERELAAARAVCSFLVRLAPRRPEFPYYLADPLLPVDDPHAPRLFRGR